MEKKNIVKYIDLYNKYEESSIKKEPFKFNEADKILINEGNKELGTNKELLELYNKPLEERKKYVEEQQQILAEENEDIKAIKESFGFDVQNIDNKKLENGTEIFKFYAPKLQRTVVLQNRKDKSLAEQLKEKQAFDESFQTSNDVQNTDNMLDDERNKNNVELKMIYINELDNYKNTIGQMKPENLKKLNYLVKNAEALGIKKINLDNLIYLDQDDNVREVVYDKEKDLIEDQNPNTLNNNVETINTSDRIDNSLSHDDQVDALSDEYEDKPEEKQEIEDFQELDLNTQLQVETYAEQPYLLNGLDEEERKKWEHYIELYKQDKQKKYIAPEMPKQKVLTPNGRGNGTVDIILLSVITLIATAAMFLVAYQFYK